MVIQRQFRRLPLSGSKYLINKLLGKSGIMHPQWDSRQVPVQDSVTELPDQLLLPFTTFYRLSSRFNGFGIEGIFYMQFEIMDSVIQVSLNFP
jgi:hypothetical protein